MAGSSSSSSSSRVMTWHVEYSRFMVNPPRKSLSCPPHPHPRLLPGNSRTHSLLYGGEWLTPTSKALAKLTPLPNSQSLLLTVSLNHRIMNRIMVMEEHSVMKLHFSWPQMACASQSTVRGSRAIFASFKDSAGQVQKFALRFLNASESRSFINTLKRSLKYSSIAGTLSNDSAMNMQSQGRLTTITEELHVNTDEEDHAQLNTVDDPFQLSFAGVGSAFHEETTRSMTNFLASCCTAARQDAAELKQVTDEFHSEYSFARYMSGTSFNAMMNKLDRVIIDLGGDLAL